MIQNIVQSVKNFGLVIWGLMADLFLDAFRPNQHAANTETKWFARATIFMGTLGIISLIMLAM